MRRHPLIRLIGLLLLICLIPLACSPTPRRSASASQLKLIVLVVFDQMRGDYLSRWADQYSDGGFRRICRDGAWFTNCHYPYSGTTTGPGHASLSTGCSPDRHGIIGNEWYDTVLGKDVSCVSTDRARTVCTVPRPIDPGEKPSHSSASPERLLAPTFADALKKGTGNKSRTVAISLKDRSACLPGGKNADACYWFDTRTGTFVTSTYYRDRAHDWVATFNAGKPADRWMGQSWEHLRPDLDYTRLSGPDDVFAESPGQDRLQGRVFPHAFQLKPNAPAKDYYGQLVATPFANDLVFDFAKHAIREMKLGQQGTTDFVSISFSSNDLIGHPFGPDSQEVLDVTLRSDVIMVNLLTFLDQQVGGGNYLLALSADHGICPIPEVAATKGLDGKRIHPDWVRSSMEEYLDQRYGRGMSSKWIESLSLPWIHLNHRLLRSQHVKPTEVAETLADWVRRQSWAAGAYTRRELENAGPASDRYIARVKKSYHPGRSGDLAIVLKPYHLLSSDMTGTTHGSPHEYDTHVPLVLYGHGVTPGQFSELVTPQAIVAVFANAAGVPPPAFIDAPLPNHGLLPVERN